MDRIQPDVDYAYSTSNEWEQWGATRIRALVTNGWQYAAGADPTTVTLPDGRRASIENIAPAMPWDRADVILAEITQDDGTPTGNILAARLAHVRTPWPNSAPDAPAEKIAAAGRLNQFIAALNETGLTRGWAHGTGQVALVGWETSNDTTYPPIVSMSLTVFLGLVRSARVTGDTSDGSHTIDELYQHRYALWMALASRVPAWKSRSHEPDGPPMHPGYFIAGATLPKGEQVSYHLPLTLWDDCPGRVLEHAPYDGHTPDDVIKRLTEWAATRSDTGGNRG